jgi:hypothetical protein
MTRRQICAALGVVAPAMAAITVGFAILSGCLLPCTGSQTAQAQGGTGGAPNIIGIDVKIDDDGDTTPDNTQSTLGTIDACIEVATDDVFEVDVFLDDVPTGEDFYGQDYFLSFDNSTLTGVSQDHSSSLILLGLDPQSTLLDLSPTPSASSFHSVVADMYVPSADAAEQPGDRGLLGRYTLQATGTGVTTLKLSDNPIILGNSSALDWFATDIDEVWDGDFFVPYGLIAVDVPCPVPADLKKVSMSVVDPPTEINVSEELSFQLQEVLHNNGPADPVAATSSTWATPPEGGEVYYHCQGGEVITINDQEVDGDCAPTTVYTVGYPDVLDVHINVNLPASVEEVLLTDWDIHCLEASTHSWQFHNELYAEDPYTGDPDPENNSRDLDLTLDCVGPADLKVVDTHVSSAPPPMDPFSEPTIIIGEQASLQVDSIFHNNGPYGPVYADIESISTAATYVGGDSTQWGAWGNVGCTVTPDLPIVQAELPVDEDNPLTQDYSIICDMGGIGYDDDGDTLVDEDPIGGPGHDDDNDGFIDEDACNSVDDDADTLTDEDPPNGDEDCDGAIDEDSPFYLATVYLETQIQPKDSHVVDLEPANDQHQTALNLAVVRPFTPSFFLTIDEADPDQHTSPVDDNCIVGLPCKSLSELSFPNDPPTGGQPAGQPLGSWLEVIGSASGEWSHASGLDVPNGENVGQADVFFNLALFPDQACNVAVGAAWELYDACLPPPGHPYIPAPYLEEPGSLVDQPTQLAALAAPAAYTSWSHSLDSIVRDVYTEAPTAYLWARYSSEVNPNLGLVINVLVFDLSGGAGTGPWLRVVVPGDPAQPYSSLYICSPAVGHLLILGQTPTTAVPVLTCNQASPPPGVASAPQFRQDIDTVVTLVDNVTCTAAETDVSVNLAKDENVGDGAPMSESGACDDGLDNDADGYIDLADADCDTLGASLPKEYPVTIEITNGMGPDEVDVDLTIVSHDPCQADWVPEAGDTSSSNRDGDTYTSTLQWRESILGASEVRQAVRYYSLNCSEPGTFSGPQAIQVTAVVSTVSVPDPNPANDEATNQIASIIAIADMDGDTIPNADDLCPLDPEDLDGVQDEDGCPETDADDDGILDEDDACPEDPEDLDGIQDEDGCPDIDVDGDGMPDDYEQANACLDLWVDDSAEDPDGDELANIDEMGAGTDPCDGDSDDDTFSDSQEVSLGSDPVNEDSTPEHISLPVTCTDGVDNDLDVLVDGYDLGCDIDDDGIPNVFDACIAIAEDLDGYQDADGCPDADNDMDGVCDPWISPSHPACEGSDGCPNVAEDIDDFWDEDGCPDPDNDGDGFPDWADDCPATDWTAGADRDPATLEDNPLDELGVPIDTREDYDGVIDWDGCHDSPGDDYDGDGMSDEMEVAAGSDPTDMDTDDDGLCDGSNPPLCGSEDLNNNGVVDPGETDPLNPDTDGDGLSDGLESGLAVPETPDTDISSTNWQPDTDPASTTNPLDPDSDGDGLMDGGEDVDHDGRVDMGETDPDSSDTDADGFDDGGDNCPAVDNPGQEDFESDGIGDVCDDSDGDLSTDAMEFFVGTDPLDDCPDNDTDDAWPFDTDMNTSINVLDLFSFVLADVLGSTLGEPNYSTRFDLNASESINVLDLFEYVRLEVLGTQCTNP